MRSQSVPLALVILSVALLLPGRPAAHAEPDRDWTDAEIAFFESKIRPLLVKHCYECHSQSADNVKGGLQLDSRDGMRQGGDSWNALVPGDIDQSLIIEALRYESYEMPPSGRLSDAVIENFVKWVEMGAPDPRNTTTAAAATSSEIDWDEARQFWSFQRPQRHQAENASHSWVERPIDGFVLDRLEGAGLSPSAPAAKRALIRRVTFDLIGLPPTPDDVDKFLGDESSGAYESLVERLLASPHFGERWAVQWLDLARYADSNGFQADQLRPSG